LREACRDNTFPYGNVSSEYSAHDRFTRIVAETRIQVRVLDAVQAQMIARIAEVGYFWLRRRA